MTTTELLRPDFSHFADIVRDITIDDVRTEVSYAPTGFENATGGEQTLPVVMAQPTNLRGGETVISGMPWTDEAGRPENVALAAVYAQSLGRTVMMVGTPGVETLRRQQLEPGRRVQLSDLTHETVAGRMNEWQAAELERGRYRLLGKATLGAALASANARGLLMTGPEAGIIFYGSSQAAAVGMGMIGAALECDASPPVRGIVLADAVNYQPWDSRVQLTRTFTGNGMHYMSEALASNPEAVRRVGESRLVLLARAVLNRAVNTAHVHALARGLAPLDVGDDNLRALEGVPVLMTRGGASQLSTSVANERMRLHFASHGLETDLRTYERHYHTYTLAAGSAVEAIEQVLPSHSQKAA